jgi:cell division protein ZapA
MKNLIPINIVIGDRTYRIKIEAAEEEAVRKMAKKLNDQIASYKSQYAGKDMQDYLAMVLLSFVSEQNSIPSAPNNQSVNIDFQSLELLLDKALQLR